ncbi:hypothetical protein [Carboxylicivirga sp. N1Y90]|uniref:hypothetical protein n=1 Tax=Carboxylicivirga fragile TaxID=3417571 RepID=UPI003D32F540|nr:hypothetical protein [Marinilabiliaceae bacterium N1Y90]
MRKFVPYVNLETVKGSDGRIEKFIIRTVTYLPEDSKITTSGEGKIADNVLYRQLRINYTGTSNKFDYFGEDFTIEREDVGLLERGVNVKVVSASLEAQPMARTSAEGDEGDEGTSLDYNEIEV